MLVQFSVKNYKTFLERATLSMVASNYDKNIREKENVSQLDKFDLRLLKSSVIYGANASGKSKFYDALSFARHYIINSATDYNAGDEIPVEPFLLNNSSEKEPSEFEFIFIIKDVRYRYGFELNNEKVISEWLYEKAKTKEIELFYRDNQNIETHSKRFKKAGSIAKQGFVRDNQLFLSKATQFNDEYSESIYNWFGGLKTLSGLDESRFQGYTMSRLENKNDKNKILKLLKAADLNIDDVKAEKLDINKMPENMPKGLRELIIKEAKEDGKVVFTDVTTTKKKYDNEGNFVSDTYFSMDENESSGTKKFFALTGPILNVLEKGYVLIVDELDSKLHPNLVSEIVSLFNSKESNPNNAQLIFNTHDTNLLSSGLFRRDQIWFVEKNKKGEGSIYSLSDFKKVRQKEALETNYLRGKYGATPFLKYFDKIDAKFIQEENVE
ncbi:abortive infection protein [Maribacter hydrothermalis]|uniref:Abortive infection protein n=2 Tax=Maribacter hydrothermalis TaxID=1836467 RepID=A0A1B7Z930_9FLAO|nr:ATP-binding protein [Maribacter hydrothermalis]APQ19417.1 abortive infection protein [Maribacter hydrothermalis]OBR39196.1 abortive infection protein [Maribacter hydrothermalis]